VCLFQRAVEIDKIQNLDEKIKIELGSLTAKMGSMNDEMRCFDDIEGLKARASETKAYLQQQIEA